MDAFMSEFFNENIFAFQSLPISPHIQKKYVLENSYQTK